MAFSRVFWFQKGLCFLPVSLVVLSSSTFIFSYVIAVFRNDVDALFPYISDTANNAPESCFFGVMTFLSACAGMLTMYAMYKYMVRLSDDSGALNDVTCWNKAALGLGLLSCFGMCVVATFQESAVESVHLLGALLFFLCGVLYISIETYISYRLYPYGFSLFVCRMRLIISGISVLVFLPKKKKFVVFSLIYITSVICKFLEKDPLLQKTSAGCEWIVAFSFVSFFFTYIHDFKRFTLKVKTVAGDRNNY